MLSRRLSIALASMLMTLTTSSAFAIFHHHNRPAYPVAPPMAPAPVYAPYPVAQPCPPQPCAPVPQCQPVCQPACVPYNPCAPVAAPTAAYYAPQVAYKTVWQQVPTTTYRPVASTDGCGCPTTTLAPCTSMTWQAQRVAYRPLFPNLARWFNPPPAAPVYGYAPAYSAGYAPAYNAGYAYAGYASSGCSSCGTSAAYAPAYSGCSSCSQGYSAAPGCSSCQGSTYPTGAVMAPSIAPGPTSLSPMPGPATTTPAPADTRPALPYTPPAGTTPAPAIEYRSSVPDLELSKPAVASPAQRPTELRPIDDLDAEKIRGLRPTQPRVNDAHDDRTASSQPGVFRLPSQVTPIGADMVQPASAVDAKPAVETKPASKWDRSFEPIR